jgi:hypothetical protein
MFWPKCSFDQFILAKKIAFNLLRCVSGAGEWGARGAGAPPGGGGGGGDPLKYYFSDPFLPKTINKKRRQWDSTEAMCVLLDF